MSSSSRSRRLTLEDKSIMSDNHSPIDTTPQSTRESSVLKTSNLVVAFCYFYWNLKPVCIHSLCFDSQIYKFIVSQGFYFTLCERMLELGDSSRYSDQATGCMIGTSNPDGEKIFFCFPKRPKPKLVLNWYRDTFPDIFQIINAFKYVRVLVTENMKSQKNQESQQGIDDVMRSTSYWNLPWYHERQNWLFIWQ
jgi:hypothetical protein